jgi:hypothetical protein
MIVARCDIYFHTPITETDESKCTVSIEMRLKAYIFLNSGNVRKKVCYSDDTGFLSILAPATAVLTA